MKVNIIVPCFNEKENLHLLRKHFLEQFDKIDKIEVTLILVDNGSTDGSFDVLSEKKFQHSSIGITRLTKNKGYGFGIKHGLSYADADLYCWTHADLQTPMEDIFQTIKIASSSYKPVMAGIRKASFLQKIQSFIFDTVISIILRCKIKDTNAQPKVFSHAFKVHFLSDDCPSDFSLDMYFFKVFSEISQKVCRHPVRFVPREFGEAKGGQASITGRLILFLQMIKMARRLRKVKNAHNQTQS